jgi:hypothetical protein
VSKYHADVAPLKEAVFQLPWQGTMGYMNLDYNLADGADVAFGVITATGDQELPRAAKEQSAAASAGDAAQPVCVARPASGDVSHLAAVNLTAGAAGKATPGAAASVVIATSPVLYTMDWAIDASR